MHRRLEERQDSLKGWKKRSVHTCRWNGPPWQIGQDGCLDAAVRPFLKMSRRQPWSGAAVSCPSWSGPQRQISEGAEVWFIQSILLIVWNQNAPKTIRGDRVVRRLATTQLTTCDQRVLAVTWFWRAGSSRKTFSKTNLRNICVSNLMKFNGLKF